LVNTVLTGHPNASPAQQIGPIMRHIVDAKAASKKTHRRATPILFSMGLYSLYIDLRAGNVS
jgi:hypothetical protein